MLANKINKLNYVVCCIMFRGICDDVWVNDTVAPMNKDVLQSIEWLQRKGKAPELSSYHF